MSINRKIRDKLFRSKTSIILSENIESLTAPTTDDEINTFITTDAKPIYHSPSSHHSVIEINLTTNDVDLK
jgi:hypothetical protein